MTEIFQTFLLQFPKSTKILLIHLRQQADNIQIAYTHIPTLNGDVAMPVQCE